VVTVVEAMWAGCGGYVAGWDIPGEPGNRVPRKSLDLRRNLLRESRLLVIDIQEKEMFSC
jgi:hypothetical protein